jgi:hypothetical protein
MDNRIPANVFLFLLCFLLCLLLQEQGLHSHTSQAQLLDLLDLLDPLDLLFILVIFLDLFLRFVFLLLLRLPPPLRSVPYRGGPPCKGAKVVKGAYEPIPATIIYYNVHNNIKYHLNLFLLLLLLLLQMKDLIRYLRWKTENQYHLLLYPLLT